MANADSNTLARPATGPAIPGLLKMPLGASMDLFQVLDGCQLYVDELIESDDITERMALCGRLLAGLEVLKVVLNLPMPQYLIDKLTVDVAPAGEHNCSLTTDSETLREYCSALTMLLLNQQESAEQNRCLSDLVYAMVSLLREDLKAPRFIRSEVGLTMIGGNTVINIH